MVYSIERKASVFAKMLSPNNADLRRPMVKLVVFQTVSSARRPAEWIKPPQAGSDLALALVF